MKKVTLTLDAMGGDHGPKVVVPAALRALKAHNSLHLILVGDKDILGKKFKKYHCLGHPRLSIHHASQCVGMDELPSVALRSKKDSSMRVAINLVKEGIADACVSAGNTGALMATARFVLKTIPGVARPAIVTLMPNKDWAPVYMLDLGANVDSTPEDLFGFAVMGSILSASVEHIDNPRVALLNIGAEEIKGNEQVKQTSELLSACDEINYIGYIEADEIINHAADVIVCDGFVGNVTLKTTEGVAKLIANSIRQAFTKNIFSRIVAVIAWPVLKCLSKTLDPGQYNGATFLGLQSIVVKSHGSADVKSYANAIEKAIAEVDMNVPEKIKDQVQHLLKENNSEPTV